MSTSNLFHADLLSALGRFCSLRYRVKRRPLRFFPLAFSVTWAAMLLGTTVNFIIE